MRRAVMVLVDVEDLDELRSVARHVGYASWAALDDARQPKVHIALTERVTTALIGAWDDVPLPENNEGTPAVPAAEVSENSGGDQEKSGIPSYVGPHLPGPDSKCVRCSIDMDDTTRGKACPAPSMGSGT